MTRDISYVLPLKWNEPGPVGELAAYLAEIAPSVGELIVVDGSPGEIFARHREAFGRYAAHVRPDPGLAFLNGKVNGVVTGVRRSRNELVIIADDDVRYGTAELARAAELLRNADLVRPQNYFVTWPWHALWDGPRSLINRVGTGDRVFPRGDFPGTLAVRRSAFITAGAYDGDCLFENLELMRTVRAAGGRVVTPLDLFVARTPPSAAHFFSQRIRQAYDDRAMPLRAAFFLAMLPAAVCLRGRRRRAFLGALTLASVAVAERGRQVAGADRYFPVAASLMAPLWVGERALCSWLALGSAIRGGARYGGRRLPRAANSVRRLRERIPARARAREERRALSPAGSGPARFPGVRAVRRSRPTRGSQPR